MSDATAAAQAGEVEGTETTVVETAEEKTFSQSDVDKIVADRLKREKSKYERESQAAVEQARIASLSESEQAIERAKAEVRAEMRRDTAKERAQAQLALALHGLVEDPDSVIEDLNLNKFVTDEYEVDSEAVEQVKTKYQKLLGANRSKQRTVAQPGRSTPVKGGTAREDFADFFRSNF